VSVEQWFRESKPKRSYDVYSLRRKKELAGELITRADSDYYIRKKNQKAKKAKTAQAIAELAVIKPLLPCSSACKPTLHETVGSPATLLAGPSQPLRPQTAQAPSPASSLDSILNSDLEVDEAPPSIDAGDEGFGGVVGKGKSTKRKHRVFSNSPVPPADWTNWTVRDPSGDISAASKKLKLKLSPEHGSAPLPTATMSSAGSVVGRLAGLGKIPKRSPSSAAASSLTFGQPEPGILDNPLAPATPTLPNQPRVGEVPNHPTDASQTQVTIRVANITSAVSPPLDARAGPARVPHGEPPTPVSASIVSVPNPAGPTGEGQPSRDALPALSNDATTGLALPQVIPPRPTTPASVALPQLNTALSSAPLDSKGLMDSFIPSQTPSSASGRTGGFDSPSIIQAPPHATADPKPASPRYREVHAPPPTPVTASTAPSRDVPAEIKPNLPSKQRSLYVQPKKIFIVEDVGEAAFENRLRTVRRNSFDTGANSTQPGIGASTAAGPSHSTQSALQQPVVRTKPSSDVPRTQSPSIPLSAPPIQPRRCGDQQPPSGPSRLQQAAVPHLPHAMRQQVPLPPQKAAFRGVGQYPVWNPHAPENMSPLAPPSQSPPL